MGTVSPCSGPGLIGDFYTMTLHGRRSRDRVAVVYSRSVERGEAFRSAGASRTRPRASRRPSTTPTSTPSSSACPTTCTRRRSASPPPPASPCCARSRWPARPRRPSGSSTLVESAGRVRRLPRGPRVHAEDDQGGGRRRGRRDRRRDVGAQPGDPPGAAQRVVLGRRPGRRRVHRRPRLPLHRDHPHLRRQEATGRSR